MGYGFAFALLLERLDIINGLGRAYPPDFEQRPPALVDWVPGADTNRAAP